MQKDRMNIQNLKQEVADCYFPSLSPFYSFPNDYSYGKFSNNFYIIFLRITESQNHRITE